MEIEERTEGASWRWSLLFSVIFLNICLPNLVLSYGVLLIHSTNLGLPLWSGFITPTIVILTYSLTQCWCREAADSWGESVGYRVMAAIGLLLVVTSLLLCAFTPDYLHPYVYGVLGGLGSSLLSAQIDVVVFDSYDNRLRIIKGICLTGQAVGQSLFPHIITALVDYYGYSFSYIVLGGIMLQTMPTIMFLKVDDNVRKPNNFSRYSDLTYAIFSNDHHTNNYYTTELQLHDLGKKSWKSPTDDNLCRTNEEHVEELYDFENDVENDSILPTITPPPSPEEKRRNIFGVEILPEIPEESEESDDSDDKFSHDRDINKNKKRLSNAIKRLSILGDNFDEYIVKQIRRDSQSDRGSEREFSEIEVTYDNVSPITEIEREKVFNSFSFRCQSAYVSLRRKMWMPSYRVYRIRRRMQFLMYNINDTFIKPLTRSLSCWQFYPSLMLCFSRLSLTAVVLTLLPMIASQMQPKISMSESDFLLSLHGFTWLCFLLSTPWLAQTPKKNFKYVAVVGLMISTAACFVLAEANSHDSFSIGCVVAGLGFGAITCCWETAAQDFIGARKWPKFLSTLEILAGTLLTVLVVGLSFIIEKEGGFQYSMFILGIILSVITVTWSILAAISLYMTKIKSLRLGLGRRLI